MTRTQTPNSGLWKHGLLITMLFGFTVMLVGGFFMYKSKAPIPEAVVTSRGEVLFTAADIQAGQELFRKRDLMNYGSILGHGAYLGPDYTAETLHWIVEALQEEKSGGRYAQMSAAERAGVDAQIKEELRVNRYDDSTRRLLFTDGQARAFHIVSARYDAHFTDGSEPLALPKGALLPAREQGDDPAQHAEASRQFAAFVTWTAWLSTAKRPEANHSYTNNWPYDAQAGNGPTAGSVMWSAASVAGLIFFLAVIIFFWHRYRLEPVDAPGASLKFDILSMPLTPSQKATAKFFVVAFILFLAQALLGGKMAHDYADGASFYGFPLNDILPFNVARTWHLQLAIFWIATAWLGMGIFTAPLVNPKEPKGQKTLVNILFTALVIVVVGSLAGEYMSVKGMLGDNWYWFGTQGWEYLELGRLWMYLLIAGMLIWLFIVYRGLRGALQAEGDKGGLTHLLLYSAAAIPVFYCFALFIGKDSHITMADYWRWWLIHLWVEGMFEVFAVVVIGFLMVRLGLVTARSTLRALYFQLTILLGSGIIGTGHHYYWIGAPEFWMALGSIFSALEVIPLSLLMVEAYGQYRVVREGGREFPYKVAFSFLVATAFWNLFGAGVLGFLINLPFVSYFQHGNFLTAAHAHGALMGVYGMLALALGMFSLRNIIKPDRWKERWMMTGFWGLNAGLMGMILMTLLPIGTIQSLQTYERGYWWARSFEFYSQPVINKLLWLRMVPDTVFIVVGILPIVAGLAYGYFHLRRTTAEEAGAQVWIAADAAPEATPEPSMAAGD